MSAAMPTRPASSPRPPAHGRQLRERDRGSSFRRPRSTARNSVHAVFVALIVLLTAALYAPSLRNEFVFDDVEMVARNASLDALKNVPRFFTAAYWREARAGRSYRPVVETTLAVDAALGWRPPVGMRVTNIALLAVVGGLVYALAWRLTRSPLSALLAGLVFAVHPMHLETVTLIKNRSEVLAALFGTLALLWFLRAAGGVLAHGISGGTAVSMGSAPEAAAPAPVREPLQGGRCWWAWWPASILATALALGSKEVAAAVPFVVTAAAVTLVPRGRRRRALALTVPAWLLTAGFVVFLATALSERYVGQRAAEHVAVRELLALGPGGRVLATIKTAGTYLGLLVWPFRTCADRGFSPPNSAWSPDASASAAGTALAAGLLVLAWRRSRRAAFALLWVGLAVAPVCNVFFDARRPIAEPRTFGATIPLALLAGLVFGRPWSRPSAEAARSAPAPARGRVVLAAANHSARFVFGVWLLAAVLTVLSGLPHWRTNFTLWRRTAQQSPEVWRAQYNYGVLLGRRGRFEESVFHLRRALRLDPRSADTLHNLALSLLALGQHDEAEQHLRRALEIEPQHERARAALDFLQGESVGKR